MPSFIGGPIKITNVSGDGTVNFGDVLQITPKSTVKSHLGSGGGNNGDFMQTNTFVSFTNTADPDIADANNVANN
ncbi:spore germination protein [Anoxybacillus sp. J5B_2022]|uniref:spore germination protein n=1 Tax=Anoxybacillus sp. J5B_2022 TaxID=3003246 RepID=UPI002285DCFB|nr:spore germination protein [Anoxybacillus sp. J5B_2022]MCZ0755379.1 spore germination protein [Anoxybacillus sp. J5B_2022]